MAGINRKALLALAGAFLLSGVLRIVLYGKTFAVGFTQLYCTCIVLFWIGTIRKRVTDPRLRRTIHAVAVGLLVYLLLQTCRYEIFHGSVDIGRYLWYAYYIPMTVFPVLLLAVALLIHRPEDRPLPRWFWLVAALGALLALGVMTNDLHFQFTSFSGPVMDDDGTEKSGWLLYAIYASFFILYFIDYGIYLYKSRTIGGRLRLLPLVPLLAAAAYFALYPLKLDVHVLGFRVWTIGEMLVFCLIGSLEICIQTGMIPANTAYEKLFSLAGIPAVILDSAGDVRYAAAGTVYPFPDNGDLQIMSHPIHGGRIEWAADVGQLRQLGRELTDANVRIEARNAYLTAEAGTRAEQAEMQTRSEIYDSITRIIRPQAEEITALLNAATPEFDERLRRIAVLSAYIKRRSNMELIAEGGALPFEELTLAVGESLRYVRLSGVNATSFCEGGGSFPAPVITDAYEQFEQVLESSLGNLHDLMVYLDAGETALSVRLLIRADDLSVRAEGVPPAMPGFIREVSVIKNEQDMILAFTYTGGGAVS